MSYVEYKNREDWLANRYQSLGASEMAIAYGIGFRSRLDLWKEKTGKIKSQDLSDNERVIYGTEAEKYLRGLFALKHIKEYTVDYHAYRVYHNYENPFITATLDGELTEIETGRKGIYECKTCLIMGKRDEVQWQGQIPQNYFIQCLSQLYSTGFEFVVLNAELRHTDGSSEIREYKIERKDHENDIAEVVKSAKDFWRYVETNTPPPEKITI